MAIDPAEVLRSSNGGDRQSTAPLAGTRSQSMQRLQVGLFGLAAMILLVALANIIISSAEQNEARVVPEAAPTVASEGSPPPVSDPLAEAGVVPNTPNQVQPAPRSQGVDELSGQPGDAAPALQP